MKMFARNLYPYLAAISHCLSCQETSATMLSKHKYFENVGRWNCSTEGRFEDDHEWCCE